jgi:hypothetical protein
MAITNGPAENSTTAIPWSTGAASWNCKQTPVKEASVSNITWIVTAIWEMTVSVLTKLKDNLSAARQLLAHI